MNDACLSEPGWQVTNRRDVVSTKSLKQSQLPVQRLITVAIAAFGQGPETRRELIIHHHWFGPIKLLPPPKVSESTSRGKPGLPQAADQPRRSGGTVERMGSLLSVPGFTTTSPSTKASSPPPIRPVTHTTWLEACSASACSRRPRQISPLIVDPDTMLTLGVTAQRLKPASWNCRHIHQLLGVVQHPKLPPRTLQPRGPEVSAPWQRAAGAPVRQCIRTLASTKSLRSDAAVMASAASSGRTSCGMSSGYRLSM